MKSFVFYEGEDKREAPQEEPVPKVEDLSPVLFEDSPSSSPCLPGSETVSAAASEVFGKSVEEAVREMRFRIEQKTMLTASAGEAGHQLIFFSFKCEPLFSFPTLSMKATLKTQLNI